MNWLLALGLLLSLSPSMAQQDQPPNSLLLIAKPELSDRNFARTVVLVTQTEDSSTVGVILNRPTTLQLKDFLSREFPTENYKDPIYVGGPVMRQAVVAIFRSERTPGAA